MNSNCCIYNIYINKTDFTTEKKNAFFFRKSFKISDYVVILFINDLIRNPNQEYI